ADRVGDLDGKPPRISGDLSAQWLRPRRAADGFPGSGRAVSRGHARRGRRGISKADGLPHSAPAGVLKSVGRSYFSFRRSIWRRSPGLVETGIRGSVRRSLRRRSPARRLVLGSESEEWLTVRF